MDKGMRRHRPSAWLPCLLVVVLPPAVFRAQASPDDSSPPVFPGEQAERRPFQSFPRVAREPDKNNGLSQFFRVESPEVDARVSEAMTLMEQKKYGQAWKPLNAAIEAEPEYKDLYPIRALLRCILMKQGDTNALAWAEYDVTRGNFHPGHGFTDGVEGSIALRRRQYELAVDRFSWAIDHDADLHVFRLERAYSFLKLKKWKQAISDLDRVVQHDATSYKAYEYLGFCHAQLGEWKRALEDMDRSLKLRPRDTKFRFSRLMAALNHEQYDIALADLKLLAAQRPDSSFAFLYLRSIILWATGKDLALVKADLDRAIELEPREWTMHAFRAILNYKQTRYATALGDLALCGLALNHERFSIYWKYAQLEDGEGQFFLVIYWKITDRTGQPKKAAEAQDLEQRLTNLGMKMLWTQAKR
jgi:Tfp pilus assembly protein PilF